jgi:hypothetical protein
MFISLSLSSLFKAVFDVTSLQVSLVTAVAPYERHLAHKRHPSLPPVDAESSTALSPKAVDEREVRRVFVL